MHTDMLFTYAHGILGRLRREDDGQALIEYQLIIFLVAITLIGGLILVRDDLASFFGAVADQVTSALT